MKFQIWITDGGMWNVYKPGSNRPPHGEALAHGSQVLDWLWQKINFHPIVHWHVYMRTDDYRQSVGRYTFFINSTDEAAEITEPVLTNATAREVYDYLTPHIMMIGNF